MILAFFLGIIEAKPSSANGIRDTDFVYAIDPVIHPLHLKSKPTDPDTTWYGKPEYMLAMDTVWNSTPIVVGFFNEKITKVWIKYSLSPEPEISSRTNGYVFVPTHQRSNACRRFAMEAFGDSGGKGEIQAVVFANADRDPKQEIGILIRTAINSHGGNNGCDTYYHTYFFDDLTAAKGDSLKPLSKLNQRFGYTVGCNEASEKEHAELWASPFRKIHAPPYRNAREVKARLKKLGY